MAPRTPTSATRPRPSSGPPIAPGHRPVHQGAGAPGFDRHGRPAGRHLRPGPRRARLPTAPRRRGGGAGGLPAPPRARRPPRHRPHPGPRRPRPPAAGALCQSRATSLDPDKLVQSGAFHSATAYPAASTKRTSPVSTHLAAPYAGRASVYCPQRQNRTIRPATANSQRPRRRNPPLNPATRGNEAGTGRR
jgi:hypothetical protein